MSRPLIIALGAGLEHRHFSDPPRMWIGGQTRLRAEAAARLWKKNPESLIVCSGGKPSPNSPSEAEAMKDHVLQSPWNIPESSILTENESAETAGNVRNTVSLLRAQALPTDTVTLIAGRRHIRRASRYFNAHGIRVKAYTACEVLGMEPEAVSPSDRLREMILSCLQIIDRKGYLPTWMKHRARKA